ncbi:putative Ribonuclease [Blattamonas nauphoetae]|uniref:Ribonuclease n=1 Tax=Blattamonas nauphoetae TaxID=2049346 RepID=A0ABQ9XFS6_9EUKA|nr:putative Ribonuclease [Blattamonas nauphoetae]
MLFALIFLFVAQLRAKCSISPGFIDIDVMKECFNEWPYSPTSAEVTDTLRTVREILNEYSFLDHLRNPPASSQMAKIDLLEELDKIDPTSFTTMLEFYQSIDSLISRAKDAHFNFYPPCAAAFSYLFPYHFDIQYTNDIPHLYLINNEDHKDLTQWYERKSSIQLNGARIIKMGLTEVFDDKTPFQFLHEWAEEYVFQAKRPTNRFNRALRMNFVDRKGTARNTDKVWMEVELNNTIQKVAVRFVGFFNFAKNVTSIDEVCPLRQQTNSEDELPQFVSPQTALRTMDNTLLDMERPHRRIANENIRKKATLLKNQNKYVLASNSDNIFGVSDPESKVGVLRITAFGKEDPEITAYHTASVLKLFYKSNNEKLILDLRGNAGGFVALENQILHFLFPHIWPYIPEMDNQHTAWREMYHQYMSVSDEYIVDPVTYQKLSIFNNTIAKPFTYLNGTRYTRDFQTSYRFNVGTDYIPSAVKKHWKNSQNKRKGPLYNPDDVIILVDGMCGSACGLFVKIAKTYKVGKVVYLGGYPLDSEPQNVDIGEFSGGSVFGVEGTNQVAQGLKKETPIHYFPRNTTEMSFTHTIVYSLDPATKGTLWEFEPVQPSHILRYYHPYPEVTPETLDQLMTTLKPVYHTCDDGMMKTSPKCDKRRKANKKHRFIGHVCKNAKFDMETCVEVGCDYGYYEKDGACVPVPVLKPIPITKGIPKWLIALLNYGLDQKLMIALILTALTQGTAFSGLDQCEANYEPGDYNMLFLSTMYAATQCLRYGSKAGVGPIRGTNEFTIHGLWANYNASKWPQDCNSSYPFNIKEISDLPNLKKNWISNINTDESFYKHEWEKHGTCSTDLMPTIRDYFKDTIAAHEKADLQGILRRAGFIPSNSKMYQKTAVAAAVKAALGVDCLFECFTINKKVYLSGIDLIFDHKAGLPLIQPGSDYVRKYASKCAASFYLPTIPDSCYRD